MAETEHVVTGDRKLIIPANPEDNRLLQFIFQQMVEDIDDTRVRNLIAKYIKDYSDAEVYLNNNSLIFKWRGAGRWSAERVCRFLDDFYQEYLTIVNGKWEEKTVKLIEMDYPFLTNDERTFVASFLKTEGRYPVIFIASRYLQRTTKRSIQIFSKATGIIGGHQRFEDIGSEYGITRERVRQMSVMNFTNEQDASLVWDKGRWQSLGFLHQTVFTESIVHWNELKQKEHLDDLDFYAVLNIIRQMLPISIVAIRTDGRRANSRLSAFVQWQKPDILFAYDSRFDKFAFEEALVIVGHEVSLQRITDVHLSLRELVGQHFHAPKSDEETETVMNIMREVLPLFPDVAIEGDKIIFKANRTNYMEEIYQILQRKGQAMTIDDIYDEFRQLHPEDHHTDNTFIRSYMLRDNRFEAVGSKSTYQLREWGRFSGALGDLAVHLLKDSDKPIKMTTLTQMMMEKRPATTFKSCNTSIYIAVNNGRLLFYICAEADGEDFTDTADDEGNPSYVGLFDRQYPQRFWPSPLTVEGAIRSMRRFLMEKGRWPFASGKTGIEPMLYYTLRKYTKKRCVTDAELKRYQQGMADINPDEYPSNERELLFQSRCQELMDYHKRLHHLPTQGRLYSWYKALRDQKDQLTGFRKNAFLRLKTAISK